MPRNTIVLKHVAIAGNHCIMRGGLTQCCDQWLRSIRVYAAFASVTARNTWDPLEALQPTSMHTAQLFFVCLISSIHLSGTVARC